MGCCESRDDFKKAIPYKVPLTPMSTSSDSTSASEGLDNELKVQQVIAYTEEAVLYSIWKSTHSESGIHVKTSYGSPFNAEMPVAYAEIEFGANIPSEKILRALAEPSERRVWDKDIIQMQRITELAPNEHLVYSIIDFKVFFLHKRELVERHYTAQEGDTSRMVYFSLEHPDFPPKADYLRQITLFASIKIEPTDRGTVMHFMLQFFNNKLKGSHVWRVAMGRLVSWCKGLRKHVKQYR